MTVSTEPMMPSTFESATQMPRPLIGEFSYFVYGQLSTGEWAVIVKTHDVKIAKKWYMVKHKQFGRKTIVRSELIAGDWGESLGLIQSKGATK